ncbi:hypothetical protein C3L33_05648, partial [Rhododendron williamsianum]
MKELWTSLASFMGVYAFCQTLIQTILPPELRFAFLKLFARLFNSFSSHCYYDITEIDGVNTNELYNAAQLYLSSSAASISTPSSSSPDTRRLSLTRALNSSAVTFGLSNNDRLVDVFNGVRVHWEHVVTPRQTQNFSWRPMPEEKRGFTLKIKKQDKPPLILDAYLDHIMERANEIRRKNQDRFLYTNSRGGSLDSRGHPWESVPFKHPSTFDTKLLMKTSSKSIIVIEDIDCSINLTNRKKSSNSPARNHPEGLSVSAAMAAAAAGDQEGGNSITLSGLLNFTDGLWSCCGSERIFVFTTNHIEKLDPALLRSGRMDMHVFMSYCSFPALKILLKNYLGFGKGDLSEEVLGGLEGVVEEAQMTPADISEVLIKNRRDKGKAVGELLEELKRRAERRRESGGGVMRERGLEEVVVEDEEQEKRALESPKLGGGGDDLVLESFEKGLKIEGLSRCMTHVNVIQYLVDGYLVFGTN